MAFTILSMANDDDTRKDIVFKGKSSRFWPHLPPEIICLIATFHLLNTTATASSPASWNIIQLWPSRLAFNMFRESLEMEKLMWICPQWALALENHLFWQQACNVIDPLDWLIHHSFVRSPTGGSTATAYVRVSAWTHFRQMMNNSCVVCRINYPYSVNGLASARRAVFTPLLGTITTCKDHRKGTYCGICLRECPTVESEEEYTRGLAFCCVVNEDDETWPRVEANCRSCRSEWLWRRAQHTVVDREALGGPKLLSEDWETRQAVDAFIDLGEGKIRDVIDVARDKYWYKMNTKLNNMLAEALAASRLQQGYGSDEELSEDDEDDPELMSITEDANQLREFAIADYARNRILDGHWVTPLDIWHNNEGCQVVLEARHPCPWNHAAIWDGALEAGETEFDPEGVELMHPRPKTVKAMLPPSHDLCKMTYQVHITVMRDILLPAMKNIVQRLKADCAADGLDPSIVAARMSLDDVAESLRNEAVWCKEVDWQERARLREKDEDELSMSSRSGGSRMTSPVLSATTIQTTPSPPPSGSASGKEDESMASPTSHASNTSEIEKSTHKSPLLIHPIPFIPISVSQLPEFSLDAFRYVWREASSELYRNCLCSVCTRQMGRAAASHSMAMEITTPSQPQIQEVMQIELIESPIVRELLRTEEEEEEEEAEQEQEQELAEEEEEEGESEKDDASVADGSPIPVTPPDVFTAKLPPLLVSRKPDDALITKALPVISLQKRPAVDPPATAEKVLIKPRPSRKRSSEELDEEAYAASGEEDERPRTPPKRSRKEGAYTPETIPLSLPTPPRLRKRSSEELEEDERMPNRDGRTEKRARSEARLETPVHA
ncbi:uncharacterized protein LAESUDRAFT_728722 [Laetiporus sulphureus 93-53]|uniref:Uncharacterized protein n=1 Tax=Laetiporus sulphureus 93-53 TaxID=1314785 RepID=A0A165D289_9APHY|nr:uncharacterized protein LAESUDRAFT_728722 [Laetiporus sulphureus 93-53]KZT04007.1 hypothetical protein LAESUDRAFT_728722 [Laetiporus sulphureus 93-53]